MAIRFMLDKYTGTHEKSPAGHRETLKYGRDRYGVTFSRDSCEITHS